MGSRPSNVKFEGQQGGTNWILKSGGTITTNNGSTLALDGTLTLASATGIVVTSAAVTKVIDIQVTPTVPDRLIYINATFTSGKEAMYVIGSGSATTGTTIAGRFRGEGKAASASTAEIYGVHGQGVAFANLYSGTINAGYLEAIAKDGSTVVTLRGALIVADSEGTPTAITDMFGAHIRVKTSVAPSSEFIGCIIETEEFGGGVKADSLLDLRSTTWGAGDEAVTAIIDMSGFTAKASHAHIRFPLAAMDNDSTTEGDFWYDSANNVFKFYNGSAVRTITDT